MFRRIDIRIREIFMDFIKVILTSLLSIVTLFILTKLMGNRQMSQLSMFDYINGITIGSIAAELATDLEGDSGSRSSRWQSTRSSPCASLSSRRNRSARGGF